MTDRPHPTPRMRPTVTQAWATTWRVIACRRGLNCHSKRSFSPRFHGSRGCSCPQTVHSFPARLPHWTNTPSPHSEQNCSAVQRISVIVRPFITLNIPANPGYLERWADLSRVLAILYSSPKPANRILYRSSSHVSPGSFPTLTESWGFNPSSASSGRNPIRRTYDS